MSALPNFYGSVAGLVLSAGRDGDEATDADRVEHEHDERVHAHARDASSRPEEQADGVDEREERGGRLGRHRWCSTVAGSPARR